MKTLSLFSIIVLLFIIPGCEKNPVAPMHPTGKVALLLTETPSEITHVRAILSRQGYDSLFLDLTISDTTRAAAGTFQQVGIGQWHLRVDAFDGENVIRFTGETDVDVLPGDVTRADLELLPATGSLEIHVTWGSSFETAGLVLHLPFDGNTIDSSGHGNNGSANNAEYVADRFGNPQAAYHFNGMNNPITIANSASLNPTNQLSIAFWFKVDTVAWNVSQLVSKTVGDVEEQREYVIELKANYDYPYFKLWAAVPGGTTQELDAADALVQHWHHLVGVIDRKDTHTMKLYLDGVLSLSQYDLSTGFLVNSHTLYLGAGEGSWESTSVPNCAMDDFRIYTRALTSTEVGELYLQH